MGLTPKTSCLPHLEFLPGPLRASCDTVRWAVKKDKPLELKSAAWVFSVVAFSVLAVLWPSEGCLEEGLFGSFNSDGVPAGCVGCNE